MTQINRFKGSWPKVGIRPTIDGRMKGVRESLEQQTMSMAESVSQLISSTLRYPDGSPVECIISDTTIGRVAESAACAEKFHKENVQIKLFGDLTARKDLAQYILQLFLQPTPRRDFLLSEYMEKM